MTIAIFTFSLLGAMALGMPIAFALIACGVALMLHLDMFDTQIIAQNLINGADSFPLMAIPFFMLAGTVMNAGGLSKRIIHVAMTLVGHIRGGSATWSFWPRACWLPCPVRLRRTPPRCRRFFFR